MMSSQSSLIATNISIQHREEICSTMALSDGLGALVNAFSGLGIDEKSITSMLGNSHTEHRESFRKGSEFFVQDQRGFERWDEHRVRLLKHEFVRFKNTVVLFAMHPWERDARLVKEALKKGTLSYNIIVEIACTRSSDELLGARKAYHSLFDHSMEEDVASNVHGKEKKLLVALVSAYRYEGPKVTEDHAKSEAKTLAAAIKNVAKQNPTENDEVIRILSTRSKPHLKAVYQHYKQISSINIDEELDADLILQAAVECLCTPHIYFSKVLDAALRNDAHKHTKKALTRVVVTRADIDIQKITAEYQNQNGVPLTQKIEETANGNYKEFLLTLIARGN